MHHLLCVCLFLFLVVYVLYTPITKTAQYAASNTFVAPNGHESIICFALIAKSFFGGGTAKCLTNTEFQNPIKVINAGWHRARILRPCGK
jgi:hypothetical protein